MENLCYPKEHTGVLLLRSQDNRGKLYVVGIGPGDPELLTLKALNALKESKYILGHRSYIRMIEGLLSELGEKEIIESRMGKELERVRFAVRLAKNNVVSLISGGDPSVYGMYSLVFEYLVRNSISANIEVVPGVTALCASSPLIGSPISGDHAVISLSDLLTPWEVIERRLRSSLEGGFVIVVYNPSSRRRRPNLIKAMKIVLEKRGDVPIGIVKNAWRDGEQAELMRVREIIENPEIVDMNSLLFIPSPETLVRGGKMLTPRGYSLKYNLNEG